MAFTLITKKVVSWAMQREAMHAMQLALRCVVASSKVHAATTRLASTTAGNRPTSTLFLFVCGTVNAYFLSEK